MKLKEIEYGKILALRDQKYSIRKISDILGKAKSTVADAIKNLRNVIQLIEKGVLGDLF